MNANKARALINELLAVVPDNKDYFSKLKKEAFEELKALEDKLNHEGK